MTSPPYMTPRYVVTDGTRDRLVVEYTDDQPGCVSIVDDEGTVVMVDSTAIPALIEALRRILRDTPRDERLTEQALARMEDQTAPKRMP